ncbi:MAG: DNA-3-methyladenine glycosylase [Acidobacteriota bacterium]|nr:DNA-3-methyladenine glycosylase [Acidobacteriota bacterium]
MKRAVAHLKKVDPVLAQVIRRVGPFNISLAYREASFQTLVRSIAFQQLNGKAATTIFNRLLMAAGGKLTPASVLDLTKQEMRACGLSKQKVSYIRDLAEKTESGEIDFAALPKMSDAEVIEHLTRVKGIGEWSAQMFLMFALRRQNVLACGDFGVQAAIRKHYKKRKHPKPKDVARIGRPWAPYSSVACWYLWRSLDDKK